MISYAGKRPIKDERDEQRLFDQRAWTGLAIIVALMLALLARYVWLQIYAHENLSTRSENNRIAVRPIPPNRGIIYDRRGRVIAENQPAYRLEVTLENVPGRMEGLDALLAELSLLVDVEDGSARAKFRRADRAGARFALVIGEQELADATVTVKPLRGGEQATVPVDGVGALITTPNE